MQPLPHILLVDNNPDFSYTVGLTLDAAGYRLLTARDGWEALEMLQEQPVDLILSEVTLPGMDGYQLQRHVQAHPDWREIPFVFLTADREAMLPADRLNGHLTKPVCPGDLIVAVRRHTEALLSSN